MQSIDLDTLARSLPKAKDAADSTALLDNFRAAAQSITTFYRTSREATKRAHANGYNTALQDLLTFISTSNEASADGATVEHIVKWIAARMDAVLDQADDDDDSQNNRSPRIRSSPAAVVLPRVAARPDFSRSPSASPEPHVPLLSLKTESPKLAPDVPLTSVAPLDAPSPPISVLPPLSIGTKRRHAAMMLDSVDNLIASDGGAVFSPMSRPLISTPSRTMSTGAWRESRAAREARKDMRRARDALCARMDTTNGRREAPKACGPGMDIDEDDNNRPRKRVSRR
ncbi:hypothetical protein FISHEDRAFT_71882 [Fistulina hepatica ATCC 64428]|uniref:Uncharacterized protein n=1 Tax=Fistulina hepatica ATCC 64428 TaxID=1128425 RepID=A0A0D7AIX7_9AGAR|nr:hypothetical protein FISHEDRAFT_71882 [Fistulina hepatica ATCC 64428]